MVRFKLDGDSVQMDTSEGARWRAPWKDFLNCGLYDGGDNLTIAIIGKDGPVISGRRASGGQCTMKVAFVEGW